MGKKARLKAIKSMAKNMPLIMTETHEKQLLKGSEILEWGTIKEINGKPIDPNKMYLYNSPLQIAMNHGRRFKKAWLKNGQEGIRAYMNGVLNIVQSNVNG